MGKYTDEDGIDGPFNRALRAAERDDAKARLKRMVREGASFAVHEPAGVELVRLIKESVSVEQATPAICAHGALARSCGYCFDVEEAFREGYACACGPTDAWGSGGLAASADADRAWEQSEAKRRCGNG